MSLLVPFPGSTSVGEGTNLCELPDGSRRHLTAAEYFAGPHRTDPEPAMQEGHSSRSEAALPAGTITTLAPRIADERG